MNSIEEKYHEQTAVAENFDKKIKEEEKAEQEIARLEIEFQNAKNILNKFDRNAKKYKKRCARRRLLVQKDCLITVRF